ncbi:hypothetical protein HDV04_003859 [Boothiomyces sp. JEL0838]|nr:hypothetical protein HDV04_003859 [Boothiomyces sp. JEL0838]
MNKPISDSSGLSPADEKEAEEYIENLLKGTGASINYDLLKQELNSTPSRSISALTSEVSPTMPSKDDTTIRRERRSILRSDSPQYVSTPLLSENIPTQKSLSDNRRDTNEQRLNRRQSSRTQGNATKDEVTELTRSSTNLYKRRSSPTRGESTSPNRVSPLGRIENRSATRSQIFSTNLGIQIDDTPNDKPSTTSLQLEKLSQKLVKAGFNSLHPSLLFTSKDNFHVDGTLTETQGLYLISTLSVLVSEFENRGNSIQELISQLAEQRKRNDLQTSNEDKLKLAEYEATIKELRNEIQKRDEYNTLVQTRNSAILENMKFKLQSNSLDPALVNIVSAYEQKIEDLQKSPTKDFFKDIPEQSLDEEKIKQDEIQKLKQTIESTRHELNEVYKERDLLKLQLLNKKPQNGDVDVSALGTRERIIRDKKKWKEKAGKFENLDSQEARATLLEICAKLGITDYENLSACIDRIIIVVKLVPQMEKFIRQVNATVRAYTIKDNQSQNTESMKLEQTVEVIRNWAEMASNSKEANRFITRVHDILGIPISHGSYELCLTSMATSILQRSKSPEGIQPDFSQQALLRFIDLFEIKNTNQILTKMNELYIFWTEVNAALLKLQQVLKVDKVQPGRLIVIASEMLEKNK